MGITAGIKVTHKISKRSVGAFSIFCRLARVRKIDTSNATGVTDNFFDCLEFIN